MTTRSDYFIQKSLDHFYLNAPIPNIGDATGLPAAATAGNLYAALLVSGVEANYGSYARVAIPRTASGFTRTNNIVSNVSQLNFPKATSGDNLCNQVAIYDRITAGEQFHLETIDNAIHVTTNVLPIIEAGFLTVTGS